jgi:hypothetical protein
MGFVFGLRIWRRRHGFRLSAAASYLNVIAITGLSASTTRGAGCGSFGVTGFTDATIDPYSRAGRHNRCRHAYLTLEEFILTTVTDEQYMVIASDERGMTLTAVIAALQATAELMRSRGENPDVTQPYFCCPIPGTETPDSTGFYLFPMFKEVTLECGIPVVHGEEQFDGDEKSSCSSPDSVVYSATDPKHPASPDSPPIDQKEEGHSNNHA